MKKLFLFLFLCSVCFAGNPESQIIIVDNFISTLDAQTLIQYYNSQQHRPNETSDNEISISSIQNNQIKRIIKEISDRVIQLMRQSYPLKGKTYHLDHGGLYLRIAKNYCPYHADNIYFMCPVHGKDQGQLRRICPGNCFGAKFIPNHTSWREFTALVYLNGDFEGGEILFEDGPHNQQYQKTIPIRSNLLVLAPNGPDFYHEVLPILKGKRYSLHMWFTSDSRYWYRDFVGK